MNQSDNFEQAKSARQISLGQFTHHQNIAAIVIRYGESLIYLKGVEEMATT